MNPLIQMTIKQYNYTNMQSMDSFCITQVINDWSSISLNTAYQSYKVFHLMLECLKNFICDRICKKVPFSHIKFDPFFQLPYVTCIIASMCLQFSMNMSTLVGYILIQTESQSVQGVNS